MDVAISALFVHQIVHVEAARTGAGHAAIVNPLSHVKHVIVIFVMNVSRRVIHFVMIVL